MQNWIEVDDLNTESLTERKLIRGVEVDLLVSPYDIPEAVRGYFDKSKSRFVVEFKYIGDEPTVSQAHDQYLTLFIGENSGRLFELEIDVEALKAESVGLRVGVVQQEINKALDSLIQKTSRLNRKDNYRLAQKAVLAKQSQLFEAVA